MPNMVQCIAISSQDQCDKGQAQLCQMCHHDTVLLYRWTEHKCGSGGQLAGYLFTMGSPCFRQAFKSIKAKYRWRALFTILGPEVSCQIDRAARKHTKLHPRPWSVENFVAHCALGKAGANNRSGSCTKSLLTCAYE